MSVPVKRVAPGVRPNRFSESDTACDLQRESLMIFKRAALAITLASTGFVLGVTGSATAGPIGPWSTTNTGADPINDRSPSIAISAPNSGDSLQTALNNIFGQGVSAHGPVPLASEQQIAGLWQSAYPTGPVTPTL